MAVFKKMIKHHLIDACVQSWLTSWNVLSNCLRTYHSITHLVLRFFKAFGNKIITKSQ